MTPLAPVPPAPLPGLDPVEQAEGAPPAELAPDKPRRGRPPGSKNKPAEPPASSPEPGPLADEKAVATAWLGLWILVSIVARFLGYVPTKAPPEGPEGGGPLTLSEAREDARQLLPLVQRYPGVARVLSWIGAPVVIVRRLSEKFQRKPKVAPVEPPLKAEA